MYVWLPRLRWYYHSDQNGDEVPIYKSDGCTLSTTKGKNASTDSSLLCFLATVLFSSALCANSSGPVASSITSCLLFQNHKAVDHRQFKSLSCYSTTYRDIFSKRPISVCINIANIENIYWILPTSVATMTEVSECMWSLPLERSFPGQCDTSFIFKEFKSDNRRKVCFVNYSSPRPLPVVSLSVVSFTCGHLGSKNIKWKIPEVD